MRGLSYLNDMKLLHDLRELMDLRDGDVCDMFTPEECWNCFHDAGYVSGCCPLLILHTNRSRLQSGWRPHSLDCGDALRRGMCPQDEIAQDEI